MKIPEKNQEYKRCMLKVNTYIKITRNEKK